uniref:Uncharacterized protein n=1 Tax=Vespula pensylvanica TaxID=30213 RepID=A0A834NYK5_VESPE|nr:hypothetical protein H0235_009304 [Vespula pensylvanica]
MSRGFGPDGKPIGLTSNPRHALGLSISLLIQHGNLVGVVDASLQQTYLPSYNILSKNKRPSKRALRIHIERKNIVQFQHLPETGL